RCGLGRTAGFSLASHPRSRLAQVTRYASVYPLVTARALAREFTYEVPDEVRPGAVVEVRFGNAKRRGVVTEVDVAPPDGINTSPVERVVEELPRPLVELALWMAEYYGSTPARALALVAPVQRRARGERPQPAERDALPGEAEPESLSESQRAALERIVAPLAAGESANLLLWGATGSGKTEVYLQACAAALELGRSAIVLVPEIALTPQALGRFRARFGERIAVLHSALTEAERLGARRAGGAWGGSSWGDGWQGRYRMFGSSTSAARPATRCRRRCSPSSARSPTAAGRRSSCSTAAASRRRCTAAPVVRRSA